MYDIRIELGSGAASELGEGFVLASGGPVGAVGRHRAEGVAAADDPGDQRDLRAAEAVRIASSIEPLVAAADGPSDLGEHAADLLEHELSFDRVQLDDG